MPGYDFTREHAPATFYNPLRLDLDLPRIRRGGIDALGCLMFAGFKFDRSRRRFWRQLDCARRLRRAPPGRDRARAHAPTRSARRAPPGGWRCSWASRAATPIDDDVAGGVAAADHVPRPEQRARHQARGPARQARAFHHHHVRPLALGERHQRSKTRQLPRAIEREELGRMVCDKSAAGQPLRCCRALRRERDDPGRVHDCSAHSRARRVRRSLLTRGRAGAPRPPTSS